MRDIIFRGKRVDNDKWVEGYYVCLNEEKHFIYSGYAETDCGSYYPDYCEVIPETVGQYSGLTDKNGKKIFEDDIAMFDDGDIVYIGFVDGVYRLFNKNGHYTVSVHNHYAYIEIIGNIHDNNLEDFEDGR